MSAAPEVVLIGRPNAGKSSLFNALTGASAHVGNFPGVTVDVLEGEARRDDGRRLRVVDLPGLYSLEAVVDPATDEGVARRFLDARPDSAVAVVVDPTRLVLGLRLVREVQARRGALLVVATQRDILEREGRVLDAGALAEHIGAPVVHVSCRDPAAREEVMRALEDLQREDAPQQPPSWDPELVAREVLRDAAALSPEASRRRTATARADAVLLHPFLGPILFGVLMAAAFAAVFLIADPVSQAVDRLNAFLRVRLAAALGEGLLSSFLADGVLGGAGTVLAFMPQIVLLTVAMELLEASGYLARGAFLVDRMLRAVGLSGRSFVPLLMGHACAVPAIAATRVVRDPRERLTTMLVLPLMTCSARLPTYALVISSFFAASPAWVKGGLFVTLYFAGMASGLLAALVLRRTAVRGRSLPLVLEMPSYRAPQPAVVVRKALRAAWGFTRDVATTIVVVASLLWVLLSVPSPWAPAEASLPRIERSVAASVGRALEPVTAPLGFDWRINVGLIGSFGAREVMVGTMGVIFGVEDAGEDAAPLAERLRTARRPDGSPLYDSATALSLLAFFVLACQCMSTVAAVRRETRSWRWPAFVVVYTYALAYAAALLVHVVVSRF